MTAKLSQKRSVKEYRLFIEAWFFLAVARILILWIPFRKLLPLLGRQVSQEEAEIVGSNRVASSDLLELIRISIRRACRRSPWRTKCFEQALSARMMLRRRGIKSIIYFGVRKSISDQKETLEAHAWLVCSEVVVTGGENNSIFTIVGCFLT
jgi:hypothetical protein